MRHLDGCIEDDAKDVVQQSFLSVLEGISKFRNEAKFSTWLYKIAYSESLKRLKFRSKKSSVSNVDDPFYYDECFENNETNDQLHKSIDLLREQEKSIIMLHYLAEKSIKEIVQITGLTKSNVKVILHRGRLNLKKILVNEINN